VLHASLPLECLHDCRNRLVKILERQRNSIVYVFFCCLSGPAMITDRRFEGLRCRSESDSDRTTTFTSVNAIRVQ